MTHPRFCHMLNGLVMSVGSLLCVPALAEESFSLLSDEQLEQHREFISGAGKSANEVKPSERNARFVTNDGPIIEINSPSGFDLVSPVDFDLRAEPRGGSPVDMGSLKVEYGFLRLNVTNKIRDNAIFLGERVLAENVDLPSGKHTLHVTLADQDKNVTEAIITFKVQ